MHHFVVQNSIYTYLRKWVSMENYKRNPVYFHRNSSLDVYYFKLRHAMVSGRGREASKVKEEKESRPDSG